MKIRIAPAAGIVGVFSAISFASFISLPQSQFGGYITNFNDPFSTATNGKVWAMMKSKGVGKWRQGWKGPATSGEACSVPPADASEKKPPSRSNGYTIFPNLITSGVRHDPFTGSCREVPDKPHSVPEPPLPVLIAISLLWIPVNFLKRKGGSEHKK